jgi:hypothetical protein
MKKVIAINALLLLSLGTMLTGCYKDVISPETDPDGPPQAVSFKLDIAPMLNTKCGLSGCHVSGAHKPYMTLDVSYVELANGAYVNTVVPKSSELYLQINGGMSEYIPSPKDKQKVYDWIRNGAPNN